MIGPALGGYASRQIRFEQKKAARMHPQAFDSVASVMLGSVVAAAVVALGVAELR